MILVVTLYVILFAIAAFGPLRWSIVAFLLLSTIDFPGTRTDVGLLNAAKGIVLPLYLLWRLRGFSGHKSITLAPVAWILLVIYAGIAGFWSFYPIAALKLVGHMTGVLMVSFVFLRASKGGYLTPQILLPVTIGTLALAVVSTIFQPGWAEDQTRFSSFTSAQCFAAFLCALYCIALCSNALRRSVRFVICGMLITALLFDGSRIWFLGFAIATLTALLISAAQPWIKILALGLLTIVVALLIGGMSAVIGFLDRDAASNRIASAITAFYEGDARSYGLGTFRFRQELTSHVLDSLKASTIEELIFGHGTCNGGVISGSTSKRTDPNRFFHDEWLRVLYEWGLIGMTLWLLLFGSLIAFAFESVRADRLGYAKPLLAYLPAFLVGLAGENFLAAAGNAVNCGFLLLIALASTAHRMRESTNQYDFIRASRAPMELAGSPVR